MIAPAQDAEALEAHTKAMQYEKMLMEQKLINQEQAEAAKTKAEQLEFQETWTGTPKTNQFTQGKHEREYIRRSVSREDCKNA